MSQHQTTLNRQCHISIRQPSLSQQHQKTFSVTAASDNPHSHSSIRQPSLSQQHLTKSFSVTAAPDIRQPSLCRIRHQTTFTVTAASDIRQPSLSQPHLTSDNLQCHSRIRHQTTFSVTATSEHILLVSSWTLPSRQQPPDQSLLVFGIQTGHNRE